MADGGLLSMSEAFARYCTLYVPDVGGLDVTAFAQLKGAFAAGLNLGMCVAALPVERAHKQLDQWQAEIEPFWKEPQR
jgi:hypothetical protein